MIIPYKVIHRIFSTLYDIITVSLSAYFSRASISFQFPLIPLPLPNQVHRAMTDHGWDTLFTQEDAYEAFQVLVTSIEREARMLLPPETSQHLPVPVQGKFLISLECSDCRTESSRRIEPFDNITLHLTRRQNVPQLMSLSFNNLRDMLHTYFSAETVSGVECETCSEQFGMTTTCDFRKQVKIAKAPKCLCIQINRTEFDNGSMTKNNEHVSFPIDSLDLTLFAYQALLFSSEDETVEQEPAVSRPVDGFEVVRSYDAKTKDPPMIEGLNYTLKSVIVHHGTANAGHYVTYRKINTAHWLYASDDVVRLASLEEVQRQQIYLLYYERQSLPEALNQSARRTREFSESPVSLPKEMGEEEERYIKMSPPLILSPGMHSPPVLHTPPELVDYPLQSDTVPPLESDPLPTLESDTLPPLLNDPLPQLHSEGVPEEKGDNEHGLTCLQGVSLEEKPS